MKQERDFMNERSNPQDHKQDKDESRWELAKKRVAFRRSLYVYLTVNILLWWIWFFTNISRGKVETWEFPWPIYVMIGWGLGLAVQYFKAYSASVRDSVATEYEKLKKNRDKP
jgi:2TM domain